MGEFELKQAQLDSELAREELFSYLQQSYCNSNVSDPEASCQQTMKYLEDILEKIIKKQKISIDFLNGASPLWYVDIFRYFSNWIEKEIKICDLLAQQLAIDNNSY